MHRSELFNAIDISCLSTCLKTTKQVNAVGRTPDIRKKDFLAHACSGPTAAAAKETTKCTDVCHHKAVLRYFMRY